MSSGSHCDVSHVSGVTQMGWKNLCPGGKNTFSSIQNFETNEASLNALLVFRKASHVTCSHVSNVQMETAVKLLSMGGQANSERSYCSEVYCQLCSSLQCVGGMRAGWVVVF